jgi:hypothetical protein
MREEGIICVYRSDFMRTQFEICFLNSYSEERCIYLMKFIDNIVINSSLCYIFTYRLD